MRFQRPGGLRVTVVVGDIPTRDRAGGRAVKERQRVDHQGWKISSVPPEETNLNEAEHTSGSRDDGVAGNIMFKVLAIRISANGYA